MLNALYDCKSCHGYARAWGFIGRLVALKVRDKMTQKKVTFPVTCFFLDVSSFFEVQEFVLKRVNNVIHLLFRSDRGGGR